MPAASVSRSVDVLGRAILPSISPALSTAPFRPATYTTSMRLSSVSAPTGIGSPPRSMLA